MNRLCFSDGLNWVISRNEWDENRILQEEIQLQDDIKNLFYPDTNFMVPGMDRKTSEDEEELESCDSSEEEFSDEYEISSFD